MEGLTIITQFQHSYGLLAQLGRGWYETLLFLGGVQSSATAPKQQPNITQTQHRHQKPCGLLDPAVSRSSENVPLTGDTYTVAGAHNGFCAYVSVISLIGLKIHREDC